MTFNLPNGWTRSSFDLSVNIANGQIDPKDEPYCSMYHIGPENVESHTGKILNPVQCKQLGLISGKYLFDQHAVVYSKIRPNLNKACFPRFAGVCSADMYPIWPKHFDALTSQYLLYFLLSDIFVKQAVAASMRTGMPKINRADLNLIYILLPPVAEQQKIAHIISTWDVAIDCVQKLLESSRQQKKALMQQLLTGKKRLSGFEKKWDHVPIKEIASPCSERNISGEELPVLACSKYQGFVDSLQYFKKQVFSQNTSGYKVIRRGEFGYPANHVEEGAIGYQSLYDKALVSPIYVVFKTAPTVDNEFLYLVVPEKHSTC